MAPAHESNLSAVEYRCLFQQLELRWLPQLSCQIKHVTAAVLPCPAHSSAPVHQPCCSAWNALLDYVYETSLFDDRQKEFE